MIKLKQIIKELTKNAIGSLTPTNYKLNKLVNKDVWFTFLKEMNRVFAGSIQYYNPEKVNKMDGKQLNSGYCHSIAWAISKNDPSFKTATTDDYRTELRNAGLKNASDHGFVVKSNKFYDAEAPNGVANVWELPYYKRFLDRKQKL